MFFTVKIHASNGFYGSTVSGKGPIPVALEKLDQKVSRIIASLNIVANKSTCYRYVLGKEELVVRDEEHAR